MDTITPANAIPALRVLYVDDSPDDAELVSLELLGQGYAATITRVDTPRALSLALDQGPWDVVLCDYALRRADALSALTTVQARGLDVPFIVVSDAISEDGAVDVMRAGAHDVLFKSSLGRLGAIIERETCEAQLREERRRMQQQLLLADRLSSVGMLAAGIAHEINNPLAYVLGNLEFALERLACGQPLESATLAEVVQSLDQAREGSTRIGHIARDLKVFCRSHGETSPGPVNVRQVMESAINIAWNQIRHRARLTRHFERVPVVSGDEHRLGQVFLNLLVNAAQAFVDDAVEHNEITVGVRMLDGSVVVDIADNGRGMSAEQRSRVFDPFFTTKAPGVGSGIGLSISRSIVSDLGGELTCESQPGQGTTFRVLLPAQDAVVCSTRPPRAELPVLPTTRVLVVDDEPAISAVVRRLLRGEHEVVGFTDAREALERLKTDAAFDVILCDVMMPSMSGMEFYQRLVSRLPLLAARTVFMSGGVFHSPAKEFLRSVTHPVLEKPFETQALHEAVARVLDAHAVSGTWLKAEIELHECHDQPQRTA
jgi:signal transduction histidine kinase